MQFLRPFFKRFLRFFHYFKHLYTSIKNDILKPHMNARESTISRRNMENNFILNKKDLTKALINNTPIAYIIMDEFNRIHFVNDSFLKLRNLERDKTIGEVCYNISNGGKHCKYCSVSDAMECGHKTMLKRKDILPNGMIRYIDDYAIPLYKDKSTGLTYLLEIMVNRSEEMQLIEEYNADLANIIKALVMIIEAKDPYTAMHSQNVQKYATKIALKMHLSDNEIFHISLAALLHDIGKVQIPLSILTKNAKLSDDEYDLIKSHPVYACDLLTELVNLDDIIFMIRHHHERIDGRGYPDKLTEDKIDIGSRILAVADTYDAMTTDRPYRNALSRATAIEELRRVSGSQVDAHIVEVFESIPEDELLDDNIPIQKNSLLVRDLKTESVEDVHKELVIEFDTLQNNMDTDNMLEIIFDNTPCGYVLTDTNNTVLYANKQSLSLLGFEHDTFVGSQTDIFITKSTDIPRKDCVRMIRHINSKNCIFDSYHNKIEYNSKTYDMFVLIDRTSEVYMRHELERSYIRLLELLHKLIEQNSLHSDMASTQKLNELKNKAEELAHKYINLV